MNSLIIDYEPQSFHFIKKKILSSFPEINICGHAQTGEEAICLLNETSPALVLMEVNMPKINAFDIIEQTSNFDFETILFAHSNQEALKAFNYQISGFVLKPLNLEELIPALNIVKNRINAKIKIREDRQLLTALLEPSLPRELFPIPTMEGYDFVPVQDIIRCESYQRCTRIITNDKPDTLSSHHIGVFAKQLEKFNFFYTHRSHLINPAHIKKYLKEGTLKMSDGAFIPVSKRKKSLFLKLMIAP